ncbi:MAG: polyprenyl synthetase family protein [Tannerellaceae bacterium]|jgi:octaprenyl-diphosphate synthase|nr:polyprenyl synthetase family protein [Tannerellaceae bacterium]
MDKIKRIKQPVIAEYNQFNDSFFNSLSSSTLMLQSAIERIMQSTGKHIRPLLVLLTAKACGSITDKTINSAVLLELLHTASLIHDDVIDETKERRGVPSLNAFFDNRISVLVGDYFLSSALIRSIHMGDIRIMSIVSEVGKALAEGEIRQLEVAEEVILDEVSYLQVIQKKTAKLLSACAEIGAISACATNEQINCCRLFGEYLGYCFQIKDDVFDYFIDLNIGKPTGNDIIEGKVTLPLLYSLHNESNKERFHYQQIIKNKDFTSQHINELIAFAKASGGIEYAESRMKDYHDSAIENIRKLPDSESRNSLLLLADYVMERKK